MPPPADAAKVARALELLQEGQGAAEVAEQTGLSLRTCYRLRERAAAPPEAPSAVAGAVAPLAAPPMPDGLTGLAADLWILDQEINATREQLHDARAKARAGGTSHGLASLGTHLANLLKRRAEIRPPDPVDPAEEERLWRADADRVIRAIEAGVRESEERHGLATPPAPGMV